MSRQSDQESTGLASAIPFDGGESEKHGFAHIAAFDEATSLDHIDAAIAQLRISLNTTPLTHPARADRVYYLGVAYAKRYWGPGIMDDLETCHQLSKEAVELTSTDSPDRAERLHSLAHTYMEKYMWTLDSALFNLGHRRMEESIALTTDPSILGDRLDYLSCRFFDRYRKRGGISDVDFGRHPQGPL